MIRKSVFLLLLSTISLFAADDCCQRVISSFRCEDPIIDGITLVKAGSNLSLVPRKKGINIRIPKENLEGIESLLKSYLCAPLNQSTIQDIKNSLISFLSERCVCAMVIIPEQEVTDKVVIMELLFSKIGEVTFDGEKWFSSCYYKESMDVFPDDPLDQPRLLNNLAFMNKNPFHRTDMILSPGAKRGTTDIEFLTKDRLPFRVVAGIDNTGIKTSEKFRIFTSLTWGNAFFINDILTYQYTTSDDFYRFQSHLLSYTSYLPWQDILKVYGSFGRSRPDIDDFTSIAKSAQGSLRYEILQKPFYERFHGNWIVGFDYKYINSELFFTSTIPNLPVVNENVNITQLVGGYNLKYHWTRHQISFKTECYASLWKNLLSHQDTADYQALRAGSHVQYAYLKVDFGYSYRTFSDWRFSGYLRGQVATGPLLPSEQYPLGGVNTVRGYEQSQFLADNVINWNAEFYTPSFSLFKTINDKGNFLLFWDFAYGYNFDTNDERTKDQLLIGIGPGFRYHIRPHLTFKLDYGFELNKIPGGSFPGRLYFVLTASY